MVKGGDELARGRIPELGGFVCACRQDPSTVRTKRPWRSLDQSVARWRPKRRADAAYARGRIPELGGFVCACRQDPSAVRTKRRVLNDSLMTKGSDELARGRIPELGGLICACCQDPRTVRTKRRVPDDTLMSEGGDSLPEAASQSLAVLSQLAVRIRAPSGLNAASMDSYPDGQRRR